MSRSIIYQPPIFPDQDSQKQKFIESLKTSEGRRAFYGMFEAKMAELRERLAMGRGEYIKPGVERALEDMKRVEEGYKAEMQQAEDDSKKTLDEALKAVQGAREKYEELLKAITAEESRKKAESESV